MPKLPLTRVKRGREGKWRERKENRRQIKVPTSKGREGRERRADGTEVRSGEREGKGRRSGEREGKGRGQGQGILLQGLKGIWIDALHFNVLGVMVA